MKTAEKTNITVQTTVEAPIDKVWESWNDPRHITQWCQASEDWHAPYSENDLRKGGKLKTTMAAKDGSVSFDFEAMYTNVEVNKKIEYNIIDGRKVSIEFIPQGKSTNIVETFEAEDSNPIDLQRGGWQAILDSFKSYTEKL